MKKFLTGICIIIMMSACSMSEGERAAKNVKRIVRKGSPEQVKSAIRYYSERLEGEDLIEFCDALEEMGIY